MKILLQAFVVAIACSTGTCQVTLPKLISDGVVFQRHTPTAIWGWAQAHEPVEVLFMGASYKTAADTAGSWHVMLPPQPAGGPHDLVVRGKNEIRISDILFGDVWVCSGQSNMELTMERVREKYAQVIKSSDNPHIRQFLVPDQYDFKKPNADLESGSWVRAAPAQVSNFSAVAYFFALALYQEHKVPIGLINAALGGSPVEAWMSEAALRNFPDAHTELRKFKSDSLIRAIEQGDRQRNQRWYAEVNAKDPGLHTAQRWYAEALDESQWTDMAVPQFWSDGGYKNVHGSAWYRKRIVIPRAMAGKTASLWFGRIVDQDSVFVNGQFTGTTGYQYPPRKYTVNAGILREGENTIAVRIINISGQGGFITDKPYYLAVGNDTLDLTGTWKFRPGAEMPPLASSTFIRWKPAGLFNKMIAPLLNLRIKGVIWYQGEANTNQPAQYKTLFSSMITDWRKAWGQGDFPFLYVQLANFMKTHPNPTESNWAALREAQRQTLALPQTGMAVTIDIGEWNDIHPLNKADVGNRLARLARKIAYGEQALIASGPMPLDARFEQGKVIIRFDPACGRLTAKGRRPLAGFAVSADGKQFYWANARIHGNEVIVSSNKVGTIKTVRYAWADNPATANLGNNAGLPATPFEFHK